MNFDRPLSGACQCGRNRYIIQFPPGQQLGTVLFNTHPLHRSSLSTPLPFYLRVPLASYHSLTFPVYPDETNAQIKRAYSHPREAHAMRHFCGFCGTPLTYWSEDPPEEADYIQLALGSLSPGDLADLEDRGFLEGILEGNEGGEEEREGVERGGEETEMNGETSGKRTGVGAGGGAGELVSRTPYGSRGTVGALPWFDSLTEGSRLGTLRRARGGGTNRAGTVRVEWEVVEWTDDDAVGRESPRKRKVEEVEEMAEGGGGMEGVQQ